MQQSRRFQRITQQILMKIDYPRLRVKGAQKQHVYKKILKLRLGKAKRKTL